MLFFILILLQFLLSSSALRPLEGSMEYFTRNPRFKHEPQSRIPGFGTLRLSGCRELLGLLQTHSSKASILDCLRVAQLISHSSAIATLPGIAPGDDGAIPPDHSKGTMSCLNLLHILQLISHDTTLTTPASIAPGHDGISQDRGKSLLACCTFCS